MLALYDADDGLLQANAAYRQAWGLDDLARLSWPEVVAQAQRAGLGPVDPPERRSRIAQRGYEQAWRDGRRLWWVEQRTANGGLAVTGVDISALAGPRPLTGQLLTPQGGRELLQALLADPRAWPLSVATLPAGADPTQVLSCIRGEDGCMRLDDGRLLVMLPATGPAQAAALGRRLGVMALTEAVWGETASQLLLRA